MKSRVQDWIFGSRSWFKQFTLAVFVAASFYILHAALGVSSIAVSLSMLFALALFLGCSFDLAPTVVALFLLWGLEREFHGGHEIDIASPGAETAWVIICILAFAALGSRIRKAALQAREQIDKFRDLLSDYPGTILLWRANPITFQFCEINAHSNLRQSARFGSERRVLGFPISHWLGELTFWQRHLHPDDRESVMRVLERAANHPGSLEYVEHRFVSADGRETWFRTAVHARVQSGVKKKSVESSLLCGVSIDLSEVRTLEQKLRAQERLVEALKEVLDYGILGVDLCGQILFANRSAEKMIGWNREKLKGHKVEEFIEHADAVSYLKRDLGKSSDLAVAIRSGSIFSTPIEVIRGPDDDVSLYVCCHTYPLRGVEGELLGAIVSFHPSNALKMKMAEPQSHQAA